jgi:hypothetical protein
MANLVPLSKSSLIKPKTSGIVKADKLLTSKSSAIVKYSDKSSQTLEGDDILKQIQKKVVKIDKLLKGSLMLSKKESEKKRVSEEQKDFDKREEELEKKKPKSIPGIKLPSLPKMGFLDWIKNFITQTILGFFAVRLIEHLPKLLKLLPVVLKAGEFLINIGGKLLDGLVTFIDWGYKAYDATRGFVKNIFGEGGVKQFDNLMSTLNTLSSLIILASLASAGGGKGGPGGVGGRGRGVGIRGAKDVAGRSRYGTTAEAARRYSQRFGRDAAIKKFGAEGVRSLGGRYARSGATRFGRNALVGLAGKGGAKAILGTVRPLLKRLPIIGALLDFGLSVALGEDPGRAAFKAIGAGLLGTLGAAIGSVVPIAGNLLGGLVGGVAGDAIGGALYDMFFGGKKPQQSRGKVAKAAGGGKPTTRGGKLVSGGPAKRTLKKKKKPRTLSFTPRKIKPGANTGGEAKVQQVFPDPEKAWWDPLGVFTGKNQQQQPQKPKGKTANPQQFLVGSNDVLGRAKYFIGPTATLVLKTVLGQQPDDLDYKNIAKGLNSFVQTTFGGETLGFAGGGEVDTRQYFSGEDYTDVIAKTIKDSASKEVDTTIRNLSKELALRPAVGREEMLQENIRRGTEGGELETAGGAVAASELYKEIGANLEQWDIFRNSVALIESKGKYGVPGGSGMHYDGRYQMGKAAKIDGSKVAGVSFPGHSDDPNAHVRVSFRNNPQLQETIFTGYTIANHRYLMRNPKYKSASVERKLQILGYAHNQGMGGAEKWLNTGVVGADGFGTKGTKYTDLIAKNFKAKKSGGRMELAEGAVGVPTEKIDQKGLPLLPPTNTVGGQNYGDLRPGGRRHAGQDYDISGNQKFYSRVGGEVVNIGYDPGGYGNYVDIYNKNLNITERIAEGNEVLVRRGDSIKKGQAVVQGESNTGVIHYEIRRGKNTTFGFDGTIDPKRFLTSSSRFHGGPILKTGMLFAHKGEYVIDKDSVDLFGTDFIDSINRVENSSDLITKAPSIIEKLKAISGYTEDDMPTQTIYVYLPSPPEVAVVPMGSGGAVFVGGGVNNTVPGMEALIAIG